MGDDLDAVRALADTWRADRAERQRRRHLDPADLAALADTGELLLAVPTEQGGRWVDVATSTRPIAERLRILAAGDPSVALVTAMHPAVLSFWLATSDPSQPAWEAQRRAVLATAADGARWGTVTSEPGSGGDIARTRATAVPADDDAVDVDVPGRRYLLTGDKHFGSGTGVCSFMLTTAVPEGEDAPAAFFCDTRPLVEGRPLSGHTVSREWDGVGMRATQSHAVRLDGCPAVRFAWDGPLDALVLGAAGVNLSVFTAVVLGVVDEAVRTAREQLGPRVESMRPYERVEWARADAEHWLADQALEGLLAAVGTGDAFAAARAGLRAKVVTAELAEQVLLRITRVVGGGAFSERSPFSAWFEDVRALGYLRPPWGLAVDGVLATSFL